MFPKEDYYLRWLEAIVLLRKAHPILQSVMDNQFGNYQKGPFQDLLNAIEDVI